MKSNPLLFLLSFILGYLTHKVLFFRKVDNMAYVYATLIVNEYKTFEEVPRKLQNKTKEILLNMGQIS